MKMKKKWNKRFESNCKHFMHGLVPIVISIILKVLCQNTNVFADAIKIQIINQWYYLIHVENIVKEQDMRVVRMANVTYCVILGAVLHVASLFLLHAIVVKKQIEFIVK